MVSNINIKKFLILLVPMLICVFQKITIINIRLSWLLYLILLCLNICKKEKSKLQLFIIFIISVYPLLYFSKSTEGFNYSLYFSLLTGLTVLYFISNLNKDLFEFFMYGCFLSCLIFSFWGCFEIFSGRYLLFSNEEFIMELNLFGFHYPGVVFPNINGLAQYLAILSPLSSIFILRSQININKRKLLISIIISNLISLFVIINTFSFLGIISFIGEYIVFFVYKVSTLPFIKAFNIRIFKKHKIYCISLLVVLFIVLLILFNIMITKIKPYISITERGQLYIDLFQLSLKHPLGVFGIAEKELSSTHNLFLFILCDFGYVWALLFIILLIKLCFVFSKDNFHNDSIFVVLFALLLFLPFTSSIASVNERRKITWIFFGICIYYLKENKLSTKNYLKNLKFFNKRYKFQ